MGRLLTDCTRARRDELRLGTFAAVQFDEGAYTGTVSLTLSLSLSHSHSLTHSLSECMGVSIQAWEFHQRTVRVDGALVQDCRRPTSFALSDLTEVTSSTLLFQISLGFSFLFQIFLSLID